MSKVTYNGVELSVPEGWDDASLVTFVGPEPNRPTMMRAKIESSDRPNIILGRHPLGVEGLDLEAFAEGQTVMMSQLMEGLRVLEKGEVMIGGDGGQKAVMREYAFKSPEGTMQQIQVYFQLGKDVFILSGTGIHDTEFDAVRSATLAVCETAKLV